MKLLIIFLLSFSTYSNSNTYYLILMLLIGSYIKGSGFILAYEVMKYKLPWMPSSALFQHLLVINCILQCSANCQAYLDSYQVPTATTYLGLRVVVPHEKREIEEFPYEKFLARNWGTRNEKSISSFLT